MSIPTRFLSLSFSLSLSLSTLQLSSAFYSNNTPWTLQQRKARRQDLRGNIGSAEIKGQTKRPSAEMLHQQINKHKTSPIALIFPTWKRGLKSRQLPFQRLFGHTHIIMCNCRKTSTIICTSLLFGMFFFVITIPTNPRINNTYNHNRVSIVVVVVVVVVVVHACYYLFLTVLTVLTELSMILCLK